MDNQFSKILETLYQRSSANEVLWQPTANPREFVVHLKDYAVSVRQTDSFVEHESIEVVILDDSGKAIDKIEIAQADVQWNKASSIFNSARRRALKVDDALQKVLSQLEENEVVGEELSELTMW